MRLARVHHHHFGIIQRGEGDFGLTGNGNAVAGLGLLPVHSYAADRRHQILMAGGRGGKGQGFTSRERGGQNLGIGADGQGVIRLWRARGNDDPAAGAISTRKGALAPEGFTPRCIGDDPDLEQGCRLIFQIMFGIAPQPIRASSR